MERAKLANFRHALPWEGGWGEGCPVSGLAEEEIERSPRFRWLRLGGGVLLSVAAIVGLVVLLKGLGGDARGPQRQVTKIAVLPDTPPPPPKEEKRPDPPKAEQKEAKVEPPKEPMPQAQSESLKMDGPPGDGPSPFLSGPVTRENALGDVDRMSFAFYTNNLQRFLQDELAKHKQLRGTDYRIVVRLWLARDGAVQRVELAGSSGNPDVDARVRSALGELAAVREAPPVNMPQPVKLRISNRGAG